MGPVAPDRAGRVVTSLVNTETGQVLDPEQADRRAQRIALRLETSATNFEAAMSLLRAAITEGDHFALGFRSAGDYVSERFGGKLSRLGVDLRREVVRELSEAGLSSRAIAPVVGVTDRQVRRDQSQVGHVSHLDKEDLEVESGADAPYSNEAVPGDNRSDDYSEGGPALAPRPPAPVIGIDGKTYSRPTLIRTERSGEQQNADEFAARFAGQIVSLLSMQHLHMRETARSQWSAGHMAASPVQRDYVTAQNIRAVADGLAALADEWEDH